MLQKKLKLYYDLYTSYVSEIGTNFVRHYTVLNAWKKFLFCLISLLYVKRNIGWNFSHWIESHSVLKKKRTTAKPIVPSKIVQSSSNIAAPFSILIGEFIQGFRFFIYNYTQRFHIFCFKSKILCSTAFPLPPNAATSNLSPCTSHPKWNIKLLKTKQTGPNKRKQISHLSLLCNIQILWKLQICQNISLAINDFKSVLGGWVNSNKINTGVCHVYYFFANVLVMRSTNQKVWLGPKIIR